MAPWLRTTNVLWPSSPKSMHVSARLKNARRHFRNWKAGWHQHMSLATLLTVVSYSLTPTPVTGGTVLSQVQGGEGSSLQEQAAVSYRTKLSHHMSRTTGGDGIHLAFLAVLAWEVVHHLDWPDDRLWCGEDPHFPQDQVLLVQYERRCHLVVQHLLQLCC